MISKLCSSIKNMITRSLTTLSANDSGDYQVQQITYYGIAQDAQVANQYGYNSSAPVGSDALMFNIGSAKENKAVIVQGSKTRFKDLLETEVQVGNPIAQSSVKFDKEGNIYVECANNEIVNIEGSSSINVEGNVTINVDGNTLLTCPTTTIDGNVNITGGLAIGGTVSSYGSSTVLQFNTPINDTYEITAQNVDVSTHTHGGVESGGSNTSVPN